MNNYKLKMGLKKLCIIALVIMLCPIRVFATNNEKSSGGISGEIQVSLNIAEDKIKPYIKKFNQRYPEVKIKYHYYSDYENVINEKLKEGKYGDVLFVPGYLEGKYTDYFELLGTYDELSQKYNYLEQSKILEDNIYGIPSSAYFSGILYNKEVFDKAGVTDEPKTISEFLSALYLIKENTDAIPFYTNYSSGWTLQYWENYPYIEMTGNPNYKPNEFVNIINPFSEGSTHYQVYKLLYDIVQDGLCEENPQQSDWEQSKYMLNVGKVGCMAIGSWALGQCRTAGNNKDSVAYMPFPNTIDGKQYVTVLTDYCYAINKNSKNKEAARAFIDFMLEESGYALDNDIISVVKTDPYPETYGDLGNVVLMGHNVSTSQNYNKYQILSEKLDLSDVTETKRVIDAASGNSDETFDDIINDWNTRWESSRTDDMRKEAEEDVYQRANILVENDKVNLSDKEKEYLSTLSSVKVGYLSNQVPFQYQGEEGFKGAARAICDLVYENIQIPIDYIAYDNAQDMINALENKEIDVIAGLEEDEEYSAEVQYSKEYTSCTNVLIAKKGFAMEELEKEKAAVLKGQIKHCLTKESDMIECSSVEECIQAVEKGDAGYTIVNYYSATYYMQLVAGKGLTTTPISSDMAIRAAFLNTVDSRLVAIWNKCIYSYSDENMQTVLLENMEQDKGKISLMQYIESNPIQSIIVVLVICILILTSFILFYRGKVTYARKESLNNKKYKILSELSDEYLFDYNYDKEVITFSPNFMDEFHFAGKVALKDYAGDNDRLNVFIEHITAIGGSNVREPQIFKMEKPDGFRCWYKLIASTICNERNEPIQLIGKLVNAQAEMQTRLEYQNKAERDPLTELYNRDGFKVQLENVLKEKKNQPWMFAIMDLDNFKGVNDTLGHSGGDEALKCLAVELRKLFEQKGIVARFGGDEFMLFCKGLSKEETIKDITKLVKNMNTVLKFEEKECQLSISVGCVWGQKDYSYEDFFKKADSVLYDVKQKGKNNFRVEEMA